MKRLGVLRNAGRILSVLWVVLLPGDWAHAASVEITGKITRLMEASGINHSVSQVLPTILSSFDATPQQQPVPTNIRAAIRDAAMQGFQTAPMLEKMRAKLTSLNEKQIDETLAWLDTPLGRRITGLENAAAEPAATPKMQAYMEELQKRPAPGPRMQLIQDLNRAIGAQEMINNTTEAVVLATALGINAAQPRQQQVPSDRLHKQLKSNMPQIHKQTEQLVTSMMLYAYRPLSDREMEAYIKFASSPSGAAYHKSSVAGMGEALQEAIVRFMTAMPRAMERAKGSVGT